MRVSSVERIEAIRTMVRNADGETSRLAAAAIGGHLAAFERRPCSRDLNGAIADFRNTALRLLAGLARSESAMAGHREAALLSLDALAAAAAAPVEPHVPVAPRRGLMSRFAPAALLPSRAA